MDIGLLNIIRREFKRIAERKTLYLLIIVLPFIVFAFYSLIYKNELIRELPVAIYDDDHSPLSQKIIEMVESSPSMRIVKYDISVDEIKKDFLEGKIHGCFFFPANMEKDIKEGKGSTVVVYRNSFNLIISNMILKDGATIIRTASAGVLVKKFRAKELTYDRALDIINPIRIETYPLYNPNYSYSNYLVPGLIAFTFQMLIMIASVIVISSEFTHETFGELLELSNGSMSRILFGKAVPHFILHTATILMVVGIIFPLFNLKIHGSILIMILFMMLFVLACLMLGLFISSLFHDQLFATELAVFYNTPAFIFSGFTFPLWAMPAALNIIAQAMPFTHFLNGFLKIYQMNSPLKFVSNEIFILLAFAVGSSLLTLPVLKYQSAKYLNGKVNP